jgi:hypothetical protein
MPDSELFEGAESLRKPHRINLILQLIGWRSDRFKFQKRSQLIIGTNNKALSVAAMRVHNPDFSTPRN